MCLGCCKILASESQPIIWRAEEGFARMGGVVSLMFAMAFEHIGATDKKKSVAPSQVAETGASWSFYLR